MAITRIKNGVEVPVKRSELRSTIMQANNWTAEQYRKQYDIFKNKLRFYEEVQRSRGIKVTTQSPQELLYLQARAKLRHGSEYEPSQEMLQIMSVTAHSISKGRKVAALPESQSYKRAVASIVNIRFAGFIDYYDKAKEIMEKIDDPVLQEAALTALANYLWIKYPDRKKKPTAAVPEGETYGSGDESSGDDFDIKPWLED